MTNLSVAFAKAPIGIHDLLVLLHALIFIERYVFQVVATPPAGRVCEDYIIEVWRILVEDPLLKEPLKTRLIGVWTTVSFIDDFMNDFDPMLLRKLLDTLSLCGD